MSQTRIWNFGDTFTAEKTKQVQAALNLPGVYLGYNITVTSPTKIAISANGYLLQPDGILVTETLPVSLTMATLPTIATIYTITCRHTDVQTIGGTPALYAIEVGNFAINSLSDGVVLGWITHPGGALPLIASYITLAPKAGGNVQINSDGSYTILQDLYVEGELGIKVFNGVFPTLNSDYSLCIYINAGIPTLVTKIGAQYYGVPLVTIP